jgi:hypothetical protein
MDGLTFIDHLIGHLAWPLAVTGLIVFLSLRHRAAIDGLIHRVRKAKAGLFELELEEAKASADRAHLPPPPVIAPSEALRSRYSRSFSLRRNELRAADDLPGEIGRLMLLATKDPRRTVVETYQFVNRYALEASEQLDPEQTRYTDGSPDVMRTAAVTLLAPEHADVLDRLRVAALGTLDPAEKVSPGQAIDYVLLASRLVAYMNVRVRELQEARAQATDTEGPKAPHGPRRGRRGTPPPA